MDNKKIASNLLKLASSIIAEEKHTYTPELKKKAIEAAVQIVSNLKAYWVKHVDTKKQPIDPKDFRYKATQIFFDWMFQNDGGNANVRSLFPDANHFETAKQLFLCYGRSSGIHPVYGDYRANGNLNDSHVTTIIKAAMKRIGMKEG